MIRSAFVALTLCALTARADITKVVNAASFVQNTALTPGSIVTIFGSNLTQATAFATNPSIPVKSLGGVTVTIGGIASNLFYVSPTQVSTQIDSVVVPGSRTLILTSPTGTFTFTLTIEKAGAPGLFSLSGSGTRDGAILNAVTFARGPFSLTTGGAPTYLAIYATGLDLSAPPTVTIDGISVPVQFFGFAPGFVGLQQINVRLVDQLAGAGRVEVAVTAGGKTSNIVEITILPKASQGPFAPASENQARNREVAALAYVPGTSLMLLTDESDDVVRVIDLLKRAVIRTITLPEGAEPVAIAVNAAGTLAAVAERDRGRVAIIDLQTYRVLAEVKVGGGPTSVDIAGNTAVVVNQDTDDVSLVSLATRTVTATVPVRRGPRSVSVDAAKNLAYVVNQVDGSISVIDLVTAKEISVVGLGANSRPQTIRIDPGLGIAVITEPSSGTQGKVIVLSLSPLAILSVVNVNPDNSGGSSDVAIFGTTAYFTNQSGGTITIAPVTLAGFTATTLKVDIGARALAIDTKDKLLVVSNQGSGNLVLIDLTNNQIVGRINAVRSESEEDDDDKHDDREDREKAANIPVVSSLSPGAAKQNATVAIVITGKNLTGADDLLFVDPDSLPGKGKGRGHGNSGNHFHGPFGTSEPGLTASNIVVNASGTQLTATIKIAATVPKGDYVVRVATPNGESTFVGASANTFKVN